MAELERIALNKLAVLPADQKIFSRTVFPRPLFIDGTLFMKEGNVKAMDGIGFDSGELILADSAKDFFS